MDASERSMTTPRPVLIGLIGAGIAASRSPALHMREGAAQGLAYVYKLIDLEAPEVGAVPLPELIAMARRFGFTGLNITHPCKQSVIPLLDALSDDARAIGAVNTVVFPADGRGIGHNTDWSGFAEGLRRELPNAPRRRVVQLGAGGAGAAVAHALLTLETATLAIFDTEHGRAEGLAEQLGRRFGRGRAHAITDVAATLAAADGVVNTTPVGMTGHPGMPVPAELLRPDLWVADIVYFPLETELLRTARALGCRTMSGGTMAVFQAVGAFRLFTGLEPDAGRMIRHFASM
ncbi:MAG TPA: shikimate dehydrogenase [Stellaceae bacterium]|nr:shikimate dehydrogenase [Stellaceae bacterium]